MKKVTLVTGLWDIGRSDIPEFSRNFSHYLEHLDKLLSLDVRLVIYAPADLHPRILAQRTNNLRLITKEVDEFKSFPFFDEVSRARRIMKDVHVGSWVENSPQVSLAYYNPIVMSKLFLLNDACLTEGDSDTYYFWIDAGITNTVSLDELASVKRIPAFMQDKFLMLSYPYRNEYEVHGFDSKAFDEFCKTPAQYVCRGGFFGGSKEQINTLNGLYYSCLDETLSRAHMGTEENIFSILSYRHPDLIERFELEDNGLIYPFFQHLGTLDWQEQSIVDVIPYVKRKDVYDIKTSLYVLTFNSPEQFRSLIQSFRDTDEDFLSYPRKILVDNSTNLLTYNEYALLCAEHGFEHIKKDLNVGINGGRQFVAEHFHESNSEYYIFFEDDMNLTPRSMDVCSNGHRVYVDGLYRKSLTLMHQHKYDFLKLSFTEFYGDNTRQWAWYNVPEHVKEIYFKDVTDAPLLIPSSTKRFKDLTCSEGDYYYCNWPAWFSRRGNKKVFIDRKWQHPFEQTWMSHVFQLQKQDRIQSAVLNLSPIHHERFEHYDASERKES